MLHPHIEVRGSDIEGRGLFANAAIQKGEFVWRKEDNERYYSQAEIDRFTPEQKKNFYNYSYQVGPDQFYGTPEGKAGDDADYMNHSCDPNCEADEEGGRVFIKALRNIRAGEELNYDYGLIIDERYTPKLKAEYPCWCGAKTCRKTLLAPKRGWSPPGPREAP